MNDDVVCCNCVRIATRNEWSYSINGSSCQYCSSRIIFAFFFVQRLADWLILCSGLTCSKTRRNVVHVLVLSRWYDSRLKQTNGNEPNGLCMTHKKLILYATQNLRHCCTSVPAMTRFLYKQCNNKHNWEECRNGSQALWPFELLLWPTRRSSSTVVFSWVPLFNRMGNFFSQISNYYPYEYE